MSTLCRVSALDLFLSLGTQARPGFPLPDGSIPIAVPVPNDPPCQINIISSHEWQEYRDLITHTQAPHLHALIAN